MPKNSKKSTTAAMKQGVQSGTLEFIGVQGFWSTSKGPWYLNMGSIGAAYLFPFWVRLLGPTLKQKPRMSHGQYFPDKRWTWVPLGTKL